MRRRKQSDSAASVKSYLSALLIAVSVAIAGSCTDSTGPGAQPDGAAPVLTIGALPDSSISIFDAVTISTTATDDDEVARLTYSVNGGPGQVVPISASSKVDADVEVPLSFGENRIVIRAEDGSGNTVSIERFVDRRKARMWRVELRDVATGELIDGANIAATPALLSSRSESTVGGGAFSPLAVRAELRSPGARLNSISFIPNTSYQFVHAGGGIYHIFGPEDYPFDLVFTADGFRSLTYQGVILGPNEVNPYTVLQMIDQDLVGNGAASGIVIDGRTGDPVAEAEMCIVSAIWHLTVPVDGCRPAKTGSDGRYTFGDLPVGYYTVFSSKLGYTMATRKVLIIGGTTISDQHLTIDPQPVATLTVNVATTGLANAPSRYTLVVDDSRSLVIAPNGSVTLTNLPAGEHAIELKDLGNRCTLSPARVVLELTEWTTTTSSFAPVCSAPAVAADRIYFASARHTPDELNPALYVMNADGTGLQSLLGTGKPYLPGAQPNVSPDGARIAYRGRTTVGGYEIFAVGVDGAGLVNLTSHSASDQQPKWSPDGKRIAFTSTRDGGNGVYVMNADGSGVTKLFAGASPTWSPDGSKVAFAGPDGIAVINSDGSGYRRLVLDRLVNGYDLAWSPDGKKIAFGWSVNSNQDIYVLDLASSAITRLTTASAHESGPTWSPDGKTIGFASDRIIDGFHNLEVYSMDAVTGETVGPATNLTVHARVDRDPSFAPSIGGSSPSVSVCRPVAATVSARPARTIRVAGIPASIAENQLVPVIRDPSSGKEIPTAAYRTGRDEIAVLIPLHPANGSGGGAVTLTIGGTTQGCDPVPLAIEPLPAAPGATIGMVEDLEDAIAELASSMGTTSAALAGDLSTLPRELLPLAVLQHLIDHPANPNSLVRVLNGSAPAVAGTTLDAATLDALVASSGAAQAMETLTNSLRTIAERPSTSLSSASLALSPSGPRTATLTGTRSSLVKTAKDLDYWMGTQSRAAATGDMFSDVGEYLSHVLALVSLVPGAGTAATAIGMTLYFNQLFYDGLSSVLPSTLTSLTVSVDRNVFDEDDPSGGRWSNAQLIAHGGEWRLTATTLIDGWLNAIGGSGVVLERMAASNPVFKTALDEAMEIALPTIAGTINTVAGGGAFDHQGGAYAVGPFRYGPVDVTGEEWTYASSAPTGIIRIPEEDRTAFIPQAPGSASLIVRIRPNKFGGNVLETRQKIDVKRMVVRVEPGSVVLEPGAETQFLAAVFHASDERLTWQATGGTVDALGRYTAPQAQGTYTVRATSVSRPARFGTATVQVEERILMRLLPSSVVLAPGASRTFIAEVEGTSSTGVRWSATGGTIDQSGNFTAPSEPGIYRVTATSQANSEVSATADVQVSDQVMLRIIPSSVTVRMGEQQQFRVEVQGTTNTAVEWRDSYGALIDQNGLFRSRNMMFGPLTGVVTVTVRSKQDPSAVDHAIVSFDPAPPVCPDGSHTMWIDETSSWSPCTVGLPAGK